jgi:cyclic pyranopterin phosphate synthase
MPTTAATVTTPLVDGYGRQIRYLRLSLTDRCDFRCVYCMSGDMQFVPRARILTLEEVLTVATAFRDLGATKIRVTGGEPLVRRNALWLIERLGALHGLRELVLTTNGSQLARLAQPLRRAGVSRINISLDSLQPERFRRITRVGDLAQVLKGIRAAQAAGFERLKLNAVILRNRNHDEVCDLVRFAMDGDMDITFIEEMPLGAIYEHDRAEAYYSSDRIRRDLQKAFALQPSNETSGGPASYFRMPGSTTRVGFISPHSHNFCDTCNRVRLTAEGRLLLCLGQEHSVDLRQVMRSHPGDSARLKQTIVDAMRIKPHGHDFSLTEQPVILRHMNTMGG